jgi:hypothetical protein
MRGLVGDLMIIFLSIPPGATDQLQVLHTLVVGVQKSDARPLFCCRTSRGPELKQPTRGAVTDMISVWDVKSATTLEAAWTAYQNEEGWECE